MKIFVVFKVARQLQGEYVMVQTIGAFKSATDAQKAADREPSGVQELVPSPEGNVECFCEVGIHEVEVK
jgi:hypothetical protein